MLMLVVGFVIAAVLLTAEYLCVQTRKPSLGGMIPLFFLPNGLAFWPAEESPLKQGMYSPLLF